MPTKAEITRLIQLNYDEAARFIARMSDAERETSGAVDRWNARDNLAHMFEWQQNMADQLAAARAGQEPPKSDGDFNAANARIFEKYSACAWEEIQAMIDHAQQSLLAEIDALSEENLNDTGYAPWLNDRPIWRRILGNSFSHPMAHMGQAYIDRGDIAEANRLRLLEADLLAALDPDPEWQATVSYNLACHYALIGDKEKALRYLEPSLDPYPALIDWSQEDTDLASLHHDPDFLAMIEKHKKT